MLNLVVCSVALVLSDIDRRMDLLTEKRSAGSEHRLICPSHPMPPWFADQVSGQMLDHKLVIRNVIIQSLDQVVAVPPGICSGKIAFVAATL